MAVDVKGSPPAVPLVGPLSGLIVEAIPPRARKLVNAWVFATAAVAFSRKVHGKWRERTVYQVTVTGDDDLYDDAQEWLLEHLPPERRRAIQVRTGRTRRHDGEAMAVPVDPRLVAPAQPHLRYLYDGTTTQTVTLEGHTVTVTAIIPEARYAGTGRSSDYEAYYASKNKLSFVAQSVDGRDAVLRLLSTLAERRAEQPMPPRLHLASRWGHWERREELRPRPASTVVLTEGVAETLFEDLRVFLDSESEYELLGMPWHKGFLLYGPPGSGKTSIAQAMATTFDMDIYWLPVGDLEDDGALLRLISSVPSRCLLLLEDIDVLPAAHQRETNDQVQPGQGATLTGLLNALDGVVTPHGLITVMTTNREDVLDDALKRACRVSREIELGPLGVDDLQRLIEMLTGRRLRWMPVGFEAMPAEIVNIVQQHMHDKSAALAAIAEWVGSRPVLS